MMVKNYMEDIVDVILPSVLGNYEDVCKCSKCMEDIKAITLNKLQPHYVATETGLVYTKINELVIQFRADVIKEVVKAIEVVSKSPKHKK